ncbi:MAG: epimerase [Polyangiales bacterium]
MDVIVFGATGMVGQGVLRECLLDPGVARVLAVGRRATGQTHAKLRELVRADLTDWSDAATALAGYDACFYCLGVSSAGKSESEYRNVTYELALAAARALVTVSPQMTFDFVSGGGTDSSGKSSSMWARVKGETERAIQALPFARTFAFRPALIRPMHGIRSRTGSYRVLYSILGPVLPLAKKLFPRHVTTTERVGRAMLHVARHGYPKAVLENADIEAAAEADLATVHA